MISRERTIDIDKESKNLGRGVWERGKTKWTKGSKFYLIAWRLVSIYSTLIAHVSKDYNEAFLSILDFHSSTMGLLICKYEPSCHKVNVEFLILRWLRLLCIFMGWWNLKRITLYTFIVNSDTYWLIILTFKHFWIHHALSRCLRICNSCNIFWPIGLAIL